VNELANELKLWLLAVGVCLPRLVAVFTFLPFFADKAIPMLLRAGVAVVLSSVMVPATMVALQTQQFALYELALLLAKEVFIGILIGFLVAIVFWVLSAVGFFIDTQRGSMNTDLFNPVAGGAATPLGTFFSQLGVTVLFSTGGFLLLMDGIYNSYVAWPILSYMPLFDWASMDYFLSQLDFLMHMMLLLSAPIVLIMFIAEFAMALIGRFVPQINIFILAMPIKSAVGFFLLVLYVGYLIHYLQADLFQFTRIFVELSEVMR